MNYWVFLFIVFVFLYTASYLIFEYEKHTSDSINTEHMDGALVQLFAKGPQDVYMTTDTEKYIPEYNIPYYEYDSPWYGYTPFAWGNGTRYPKWSMGFPYYQYIYNWYDDSY